MRLIGKPYDRVPLATMVTVFGETYDRVFTAVAGNSDPLARALAEFAAAENRDPAGIVAD